MFDDIYDSDAKFLKINNKNTFIDLKDILFIEKAGVKIIYHTYQTDYVSYNSFNKLTLPKNFIRCHKSFIVNILLYYYPYKSPTIGYTTNSQAFYKENIMALSYYLGD